MLFDIVNVDHGGMELETTERREVAASESMDAGVDAILVQDGERFEALQHLRSCELHE